MQRFSLHAVLAMLIFIGFPLTASAVDTASDPPVATDGTWWHSLSDHEREIVMFASLDGYQAGFGQGRLAGITDMKKPMVQIIKTVFTPTQDQLKRLRAQAPLIDSVYDDESKLPQFGHVDISLYVRRITAFYDDHPEAIHATLGDVAQCIGRKPIKACDEVAAEAAHQRQ